MRTPFIAGNWKMNLNREQGVALASQLVALARGLEMPIDIAVCPAYPYLDAVGRALAGSNVALGAQDMCEHANGAYTGEVSAEMLLDVGCRYVVLGHSERRQLMGETDEMVKRKTLRALDRGLLPIVCLGETLEERKADRTRDVVQRQFVGSLGGLTEAQMTKVVIAYEPVWAIGTGVVATPEQAEQVHADLRRLLETHYNAAVAKSVRIQYGGSVKAENASDLLGQPNIDGALVGGASLKADSFLGIVAATQRA